jgi:D-tyrosyl-tRNA(Tyr) deacylase
MRVVLQVVKNASVSIENQIYSQINEGFLLLVGFNNEDNEEVVRKVIDKIISLRVFMDENGKTNLAFLDLEKEILCVSQFTLYADIKKGRRPSFINAMRPEEATKLYDYTLEYLKSKVSVVKGGVFGADMKIQLLNDGPFTLMIDSKEL